MFNLIANETCFSMKVFSSGGACANHDQNMFIPGMNETISRGSFDISQTKHVSAKCRLLV